MMNQQEELFRAFAKRADGHDRDAIVGAAGNMLLNVIRQNNKTLGEANEQLDDLVVRMKDALRKRHYTEDGSRQVQNIYVPNFLDIVGRAMSGQDI